MDPKKLRSLEREAKTKRLRLWRDYKEPVTATGNAAARQSASAIDYEAKVLEICSADSLIVQNIDASKEIKKIFLASIRPPRLDSVKNGLEGTGDNENRSPSSEKRQQSQTTPFRPLYDIPFMFEARELLRKRVIGKIVKVHTDYVQPKTENFPEKYCCTVLTQDGQNLAEQLIIKGLVTVVKYRMMSAHDDDGASARASDYDSFLSAELKAQKMNKGLYSTKPDAGLVRIVDLSTDMTKSKSFAPFLTRGGASGGSHHRKDAVVEYVFPSSTKLKLYIPKENCLINLVLAGVNTPKMNDPISAEAVQYAKHRVYQRDVQVEIETQDRVGNYIGSVYYFNENGINSSNNNKNQSTSSTNLAVELVKAGFLSARDYYSVKVEFQQAENEAKNARKG